MFLNLWTLENIYTVDIFPESHNWTPDPSLTLVNEFSILLTSPKNKEKYWKELLYLSTFLM